MGLEQIFTVDGLISLVTLTVLEIVLGIDNIIFISIFAGKLPKNQQPKARFVGLMLALVFRIIMLLSITWIIAMKDPVIQWPVPLSLRDLILLAGGVFLLFKTVIEIHAKIEDKPEKERKVNAKNLMNVVIQIALIDLVFSFDSILTAIGLANEVMIMILAVIVSMIIMLLFSKHVSDFIDKHPTIKMLALSFLIMIAILLIAEAFHYHFPKGYVYFGMAFAFGVEMLNIQTHRKKVPKS